MSESKSNDPRFWNIWRRSGATRENPFADWQFNQFMDTLRGYDNINVVPMKGKHFGYSNRCKFLVALVKKAGVAKEVKLSAPDRVQPFCSLDKDGNIYIETLGEVVTKDRISKGNYETWTISPDWGVKKGTKPYLVDKSDMR